MNNADAAGRIETLLSLREVGTYNGLRLNDRGAKVAEAIDCARILYQVRGSVFDENEQARKALVYLIETCPDFVDVAFGSPDSCPGGELS
jgi:hypothetical protein